MGVKKVTNTDNQLTAGGITRLAGLVEFKHAFLLMAASGLASAALSAGINTKPKAQP